MGEVNVTGLTRVRDAKPNKGGSTVIAYFDCEARGLEIVGCAFVRTPKNGLTVWLPKIETPQAVRRSINFTDCSLRHAMMLQARETYRALGGTDAEWIGRSVPMGPRDDEPEHLQSRQNDANEIEEEESRKGLETFLQSKVDDAAQGIG